MRYPKLSGSEPTDRAHATLLCPPVDAIVQQLSPAHRAWPRCADLVRYAFHLVLSRRDEETDSVALNARVFRRVVGGHYSYGILRELRDLGYLATDGSYWGGKRSRRYQLGARASGLPVGLRPAGPALARRMQLLRSEGIRQTLSVSPNSQIIFDDLRRFTLEHNDKVEAVIVERAKTKPASEAYYRLAVAEFQHRNFFVRTCRTGRLFHSLSSMPKRLRPLLRVDGEATAEIDIAAAQPSLLVSLYAGPCEERSRYAEAVRAGYYEYLMAELDISTDVLPSRETVKAQWLKEVFGLDRQRAEIWGILARNFPLLCRRMDEVREGDYCALAHQLQRLESDLVINLMVPRIRREIGPIGISTVHDSIVCPRRYAGPVSQIMRLVLFENLGIEPLLRISQPWTGAN